MEDWKVAGIVILAFALTATTIGVTLFTFLTLQNQTVPYQTYGYSIPYQSAPYPSTPVTPDNGSQQIAPTQPPYVPAQPTYPTYPYYPPNYGYEYPYGYGFGFGPWRGMM